MTFKIMIKKFMIEFSYLIHRGMDFLIGPTEKVMSVDETIAELQNTNKSLVRFGDGELLIIRGGNVHFQKGNDSLKKDLADIIGYKYDGLMVSIQDIFNGLDLYVPESRKFWKEHLFFYRRFYKKLCDHERVYASTSFSRAYVTIANKEKSREWFREIKRIWFEKDVVVVEGASTHNGVGNDLFDSCNSVQRIICPSKNAFDRIKDIEAECNKMSKDKLFLVSLGPAAKPLIRNLYLAGYRAIDIGQLDYEYELFLMKADTKNKIQKHNLLTTEENKMAGYNAYLNEIICRIQ